MTLGEMKSPESSHTHFLELKGRKCKHFQRWLTVYMFLTCPEASERSFLYPFKMANKCDMCVGAFKIQVELIVSAFVWVEKPMRYEGTA